MPVKIITVANSGAASGSFVIPSDFVSLISIEALSFQGAFNTTGAGGGGAYAKTTSITGIAAGQICYFYFEWLNAGNSRTWLRVGTNAAPTASTNGVLARGASGTTGGPTSGSIGSTLFAGGNGGASVSDNSGGGGGGAGGPNGAGRNGGNGLSGRGGGGGGAANNGSVGSASPSGSNGGGGGNGRLGSGGGVGGTVSSPDGGFGDSGGGGGGAYYSNYNGGNGGVDIINLGDGSRTFFSGGGGGGTGPSGQRGGGAYGGGYGGGNLFTSAPAMFSVIYFAYNAKPAGDFFFMFS